MSSVPGGQHSSGTPYGPRVKRIGSGPFWSLGVKITVCRRTPSRIGTISSLRVKFPAGGCCASPRKVRKAAARTAAATIHRFAKNLFNGGSSSPERLEHFPNVAVHFHFRKHALDSPLRIQNERGANDAHLLDAVHGLFLPDAVSLKSLMGGVAGQGKIQLVFVAKARELFRRIGAQPDHLCSELFEFLARVPKLGRLGRSTRRVRFGAKVEDQFLPPEIFQ